MEIGFDFPDEGDQFHLTYLHIHLVVFHLAEIQQLLDHAFQSFGILPHDLNIIVERTVLLHDLIHLV